MTGYGRNQDAGAGKNQREEGSLRLLTPGEIALARLVFRLTIPYEKVWIHHDSFLPFGLQNKQTAMPPMVRFISVSTIGMIIHSAFPFISICLFMKWRMSGSVKRE